MWIASFRLWLLVEWRVSLFLREEVVQAAVTDAVERASAAKANARELPVA